MTKIIDNTNLGYLISKIKSAFWPKSDVVQIGLDDTPITNSTNLVKSGGVKSALDAKQDTLVSGTNIKTINNESLLGSGNISITGGSGGGGEVNVIEAITFNGTPATITNKTAAITATIPDAQVQSDWNATSGMGVILNKPTIPAAVTESTVSGWGFTKNTGTYSKPSGGIPATDLASTVQTSLGKADTALQSYTETDPVFSASAAAGITASDVTNWNGKTSNTGTVTGVKINGTTKNPTSGVVDLGTVLTSYTETDPTVPSWAKASTKPTYTASEVGALPLAGGTMDSGAEIYLPGSSSLSETKVTRDGVSVSPNANSFSTVTSYKHGSILYSPNGMNLNTISLPAATGTIALTSDIPSVTESTVSGWGFTKNNGTITGITMNGASKGTSGVVNLGTVLTSHQDISGKANLSGATFTGTVTGTSSGNTAQFRNVTISSSEPTSSQGSNGDIWIVI